MRPLILIPRILFCSWCCILMLGCGGGEDDSAPPRTSELVPSQQEDAANATAALDESVAAESLGEARLDTGQVSVSDLTSGGSQESTVPPGESAPPRTQPPPAQPVSSDEASEPRIKSEPVPRVSSTALGPYCLQLGSFKQRNYAERLAVELENTGYAVEIVEATVKETLYYRVYLPNLPTQRDAEQLGERLKRSHGYDYLIRKID